MARWSIRPRRSFVVAVLVSGMAACGLPGDENGEAANGEPEGNGEGQGNGEPEARNCPYVRIDTLGSWAVYENFDTATGATMSTSRNTLVEIGTFHGRDAARFEIATTDAAGTVHTTSHIQHVGEACDLWSWNENDGAWRHDLTVDPSPGGTFEIGTWESAWIGETSVSVPAGHFDDCWILERTTHRGTPSELTFRFTWCRDRGSVRNERVGEPYPFSELVEASW